MIPTDFDWVFYTTYYEDLKKCNINTKEKACSHYNMYGIKENRIYNISMKNKYNLCIDDSKILPDSIYKFNNVEIYNKQVEKTHTYNIESHNFIYSNAINNKYNKMLFIGNEIDLEQIIKDIKKENTVTIDICNIDNLLNVKETYDLIYFAETVNYENLKLFEIIKYTSDILNKNGKLFISLYIRINKNMLPSYMKLSQRKIYVKNIKDNSIIYTVKYTDLKSVLEKYSLHINYVFFGKWANVVNNTNYITDYIMISKK